MLIFFFYFLIKSRLARLWAEEHAIAKSERSKGFYFGGLVLKMAKLPVLAVLCEIPSGPKLWHSPSDLWVPYRNTKNSWNSKFNVNSF
jgi:hypothetical protein